jgi:hypothetical protein
VVKMDINKNLDTAIDKLSKIFMDKENNFKLKGASINLLKKSNINRKKEFESYSFDPDKIGLKPLEVSLLKENRLISRDNTEFTLTFKGVVMIEYSISTNNTHVNNFMEDLNKNFFENIIQKTTKPLEGQEKAVIITLLGLGCLSKKTALPLISSRDKVYSNVNYIRECVDSSIDFLKSIGYDDKTLENIWNLKVIGEDPVVARFNRLNDIRLKIKGVVKMSSGKYYLDLIINGQLNTEAFEELLDKLFDKKQLDTAQRKALNELLNKIENYNFKVVANSANPDFDLLPVKFQIQNIILSHYNRSVY